VSAEATDSWKGILYPIASCDSAPNSFRPLLGIRVFLGPMLLQTCCRMNGDALPVERRVISLTDAPTHPHAPTYQLLLHLPLPVEPTMFLLLPSRTMFMGRSTMLL
jgi:hypothetical protein